jgi:hypothetical protein
MAKMSLQNFNFFFLAGWIISYLEGEFLYYITYNNGESYSKREESFPILVVINMGLKLGH